MLARQPLFKLLGAVIVLILTEMRTDLGVIAFGVWALWVWYANSAQKNKGWASG